MNGYLVAFTLGALALALAGCDGSKKNTQARMVDREQLAEQISAGIYLSDDFSVEDRERLTAQISAAMLTADNSTTPMIVVRSSNSKDNSSKKNEKYKEAAGSPLNYYDNDTWGISADFLWWQANGGWFSYKTQLDLSLNIPGVITGDIFEISAHGRDYKYEWKPGFRLGLLNYVEGFSDWDAFLNWTFFYDEADGNSDIFAGIPPITFGTTTFSLNVDFKTSSDWSLNYNTIDLEFGHNFGFKEKFSARPHLGFRGAFIHQDYATFLGPLTFDFNGNNFPLGFNATARADNDFDGFGIRGGARVIWNLSPHYGLLGQFSGSALLGAFDLEANTTLDLDLLGLIGVKGSTRVEEDFFRLRTNLEGLIGGYMKYPLFKKKHLLEFTLGYEVSIWFKQNQLEKLFERATGIIGTSTGTTSALTTGSTVLIPQDSKHLALSGLTFNARYSF